MKTIVSYLSRNQFVTALFLLALGLFLIQIKTILIVFFLSYILMAAIHPSVAYLERRKWPRVLAVSVIYLIIIAVVLLLILPIMPFFVSQIQNLFINFPIYFEKAAQTLGFNIAYSNFDLSSYFENLSSNIILITSTLFGGIFSFFTIIVISFYLVLYHDRFERSIVHMFPKEGREKVQVVFSDIENSLGKWVRGQLVLSFSVGLISWIFLQLLGVPYAFPLAFITGLLEIIPMIGPILGAIPAVIVALTISPTLALAVTAGYVVIQTIENNVLVPKIMQSAVGLNPVITIIAILVGGTLLGIWGALIAVPFFAMLMIILTALND